MRTDGDHHAATDPDMRYAQKADPAGDAMAVDRLTEAVIDLEAIAHNTRILTAHVRGELMAVVKADGFGHGAVPVARTALANGASWLGVSFVEEALALREAGLDAPILSWIHLAQQNFTPALRAGIDLSVSSVRHLESIAQCAERSGIPAMIHLKADTGLHRDGACPQEQWPALVDATALWVERGAVCVRGVWSHLAHPDEPSHPATASQVEAFDAAVRVAEAAWLNVGLRHLANSGAALAAPETHYEMVRAGIGLYGVEPVRELEFGLRPAMRLHARTVAVRQVGAGQGASYGHEYITGPPTHLALVPLGFADGLPRAASGRAEAAVLGERRAVAGRIAMDQCVIDVGAEPVDLGQEVVLFGAGTHGEPTAADWARWAETNPREILTGIGPRVQRRYLPEAVSGGGAVENPRVSREAGRTRVAAWDRLDEAVADARAWDAKVLVEAEAAGREIDIAVLEHPDGRLEAGPPPEIEVPGGRTFFDFEAKCRDESTGFQVPAELGPEATERPQGPARADFLPDAAGEPVFDEISTFPGFTASSQYPRIWDRAGLPYPRLLDELIETLLMSAKVVRA